MSKHPSTANTDVYPTIFKPIHNGNYYTCLQTFNWFLFKKLINCIFGTLYNMLTYIWNVTEEITVVADNE